VTLSLYSTEWKEVDKLNISLVSDLTSISGTAASIFSFPSLSSSPYLLIFLSPLLHTITSLSCLGPWATTALKPLSINIGAPIVFSCDSNTLRELSASPSSSGHFSKMSAHFFFVKTQMKRKEEKEVSRHWLYSSFPDYSWSTIVILT